MTANEKKLLETAEKIRAMHGSGYGVSEIAKTLGLNESTVRSSVWAIENPYPWGCGD